MGPCLRGCGLRLGRRGRGGERGVYFFLIAEVSQPFTGGFGREKKGMTLCLLSGVIVV